MQEIVRIAERPDLVPMVAQWLWDEWHLDAGDSLEAIRNAVAASSTSGPPQTFVLLVDNRPVGTSSLVAHDLDERPDLTPWLAGVLVIPEARGRGHVIHLIQPSRWRADLPASAPCGSTPPVQSAFTRGRGGTLWKLSSVEEEVLSR